MPPCIFFIVHSGLIIIFFNGQSFNGGRSEGNMVLKTLERDGFTTTPVLMAGLQMGPLYYFATYSNMVSANHYEGLKTSPFLEAIGGQTDWGEVLFGATIGIGLSRSLLGGQDSAVHASLESRN